MVINIGLEAVLTNVGTAFFVILCMFVYFIQRYDD